MGPDPGRGGSAGRPPGHRGERCSIESPVTTLTLSEVVAEGDAPEVRTLEGGRGDPQAGHPNKRRDLRGDRNAPAFSEVL